MSVKDDALLIAGNIAVFRAPKGTACPEDPLNTATGFTLLGTPPTGWENLGHTSANNLVAFTRDGGEKTSLPTALKSAVRTVTSDVTWGVTVNALQWDADTLDLAFNGDVAANGGYTVPDGAASLECSLFILVVDAVQPAGFYLAKTEFAAEDVPSLDREDYSEIPLRASILPAPAELIPLVNGKAGVFQIFGDAIGA